MFKNKTFHLVEKFKIFICISLAIVLLGGVFMIINAASGKNVMNFGIDFTGGAVIDIDLGDFARHDTHKEIIRPVVEKVITDNGCKIEGAMTTSDSTDGVTYEFRLASYRNGRALVSENETKLFVKFVKEELAVEITESLDKLFNENETLKAAGAYLIDNEGTDEKAVYAYSVGKSAADSLTSKAIIALLVAIAVMLVYIIIRFTPSSAFAAVCALVHDVLIMIALTTVFNISVNSTFVAAVITIVGYSINATIIIFDRIREELKTSSAAEKTDTEIANLAIKDTLNRTILTTVTTLVMVVTLAIFSVSTIRDFIVPIVFGLFAGAFSSVLLAPSIWVLFRKLGRKIKENRAKKAGYSGKTNNN